MEVGLALIVGSLAASSPASQLASLLPSRGAGFDVEFGLPNRDGVAVLRITWMTRNGKCQTIRIEGRIADHWATELSRVTSGALENSPQLVLEMSAVTFADRAGVALLKSLRRRGVQLVECSDFIRNLVNGGME